MTVLRWSRAELNGTATGKIRWSRAELNGTAAVGVVPLQPQTVEPGMTVTLQAQLTGGGFPDSWTWRQISGPTVTLVGSWANVAFVSPSPTPPNSAAVVIGVRATVGGTLSPEQTVTITVLPALRWIRNTAGVFVGARVTTNPQIAMPTTEDVPGFSLDYSQDFLTDVAEGGFTNVTAGSDLGLLATPTAYSTGAGKFKTKAENSSTGEANTVYSAVRTTSVSGSVFRVRMHWDGATAVAGAIKPMPPSADPTNQSQLYGRWRYRMRLALSTDPGWGTVADLINSSTWGTGTGEYGHPENGHTSTSTLGAFIRPSDHVANPNRAGVGYPIRRNASQFGGPSDMNGWHTYEIRCEPGRTRLYIDGYKIWDDTLTPVSDPTSWLMQCGKPGTAAAGTEATVEIDWITVSTWVGTATLSDTYSDTY